MSDEVVEYDGNGKDIIEGSYLIANIKGFPTVCRFLGFSEHRALSLHMLSGSHGESGVISGFHNKDFNILYLFGRKTKDLLIANKFWHRKYGFGR